MIVNRRTHIVKTERMEELGELLLAEKARVNHPYPVRYYTPVIGPFYTINLEFVFESLTEYEKF